MRGLFITYAGLLGSMALGVSAIVLQGAELFKEVREGGGGREAELFDIDSNGILNEGVQDKGAGKSEKITVPGDNKGAQRQVGCG